MTAFQLFYDSHIYTANILSIPVCIYRCEWNSMTTTVHILETPRPQLFLQHTLQSPPHTYGTSQRVIFIHLWVTLGVLPVTASASPVQPQRASATSPTTALTSTNCLGLFAAVAVSCRFCLPKPHSSLWPGPLPKGLCLAQVQLIHSGHQHHQSPQDPDSLSLV